MREYVINPYELPPHVGIIFAYLTMQLSLWVFYYTFVALYLLMPFDLCG